MTESISSEFFEKNLEKTDPNCWRLDVEETGRQQWKYLSKEEAKKRPQTALELYSLGIDTVCVFFECF